MIALTKKVFSSNPYLWVAISSWVSKVFTAATTIFSIRILTSQLNKNDYAAFVLLSGLQSWFILADFGISNSLQNFISERRAANLAVHQYVSYGILMVTAIFIILCALSALVGQYVGPVYLESILHYPDYQKAWFFFLIAALLASSNIFDIANKVLYADGRGYIANLLITLSRLVSLINIFALQFIDLPEEKRLYIFIMAYFAPMAIIPLTNSLLHFYKYRFSGWNLAEFRQIAIQLGGRGKMFWLFTLSLYIPFHTDYLFISVTLGSAEVVEYGIIKRIYEVAGFVYTAVLLALWPICTELLTQNKWKEVMQKIRTSLAAGIVFILLCIFALSWGMPYIIDVLAPELKIVVSTGLVIAFGIYLLVRVWIDTYAMILQSRSELSTLCLVTFISSVLSVLVQFFLVKMIGLYGIVVGLIVPPLLIQSWVLPLKVNRMRNAAER